MTVDDHNKSQTSKDKQTEFVEAKGFKEEENKKKGKKWHDVGVPNKIGIPDDDW